MSKSIDLISITVTVTARIDEIAIVTSKSYRWTHRNVACKHLSDRQDLRARICSGRRRGETIFEKRSARVVAGMQFRTHATRRDSAMTETSGSFSSASKRKRVEGTRRAGSRCRGMCSGPRASGGTFPSHVLAHNPTEYFWKSTPVLIPSRQTVSIQVNVKRIKNKGSFYPSMPIAFAKS